MVNNPNAAPIATLFACAGILLICLPIITLFDNMRTKLELLFMFIMGVIFTVASMLL